MTIRTLIGTTLLVLLLAVSGSAAADTVYPPTPPTETATPTEETETPSEDVLPTETASPAEEVEVLPQVLERLPVTGAALAGLLALAAALLVAGVVAVVLARRRGRATGA